MLTFKIIPPTVLNPSGRRRRWPLLRRALTDTQTGHRHHQASERAVGGSETRGEGRGSSMTTTQAEVVWKGHLTLTLKDSEHPCEKTFCPLSGEERFFKNREYSKHTDARGETFWLYEHFWQPQKRSAVRHCEVDRNIRPDVRSVFKDSPDTVRKEKKTTLF